jgi:hypothetical protein
VLHQEREDINEELRLSVWVSLLKQQMTSEKEKAKVRQKRLDVMEALYSRRQAVADKLDAQTHKALHDGDTPNVTVVATVFSIPLQCILV